MTANNKELLQLAATAIGIDLVWGEVGDSPDYYNEDYTHRYSWNSLTDISDAMQLAIKLNFTVSIKPHEVEVFSEDGEKCASRAFGPSDNKELELCRAITELAAQIGDDPNWRA